MGTYISPGGPRMAAGKGGAQGRRRTLTIRDLGRMVASDYVMNGRRTVPRVKQSYAHLIAFFGKTPASQLALRSRDYTVHRLGEGAAPATVRLELMGLSRGLRIAVQTGRLSTLRPISTPRVRNVRSVSITREKLDSLLAYLPVDERHVVQMAYLTGWRRSEILGLTWDRVDRDHRTIRLAHGSTKNGDARVFPYGNFPALALLIEHRYRKTLEVRQRFGTQVAHVFHRSGEPIRTFRRSWAEACRRADLKDVRYHDLRRCAAQNMVRAGVPIQAAMKLMGHKTRAMFDNYAFVEDADLKDGIAKYAALLGGSRDR